MTINEIAKCLGYNSKIIYKAFEETSKTDTEIGKIIKAKSVTSKKNMSVDYSFEEANFALKTLPTYTQMSHQYLKENFIVHSDGYARRESVKAKIPKEAKEFINMYILYQHKFNCCNTCVYISARKHNLAGSVFHPYCTFYNCFLNKALPKRDIYKDKCRTFKLSFREPFIWTPRGAQNLTTYLKGNGKTLGIDNSEFTTGLSKDSIILLGEHINEETY